MDVNTYKLELQLTEEQVRELEDALKDRQDKHYRDQILYQDRLMTEARNDALKKFMVVDDITNQFNLFLLNNKLM